jgi:hypothetical protein
MNRPIQGLVVHIPHALQQQKEYKQYQFIEIQFWGQCLDDLHLQVPGSTFQCKIDHPVSAIKPD